MFLRLQSLNLIWSKTLGGRMIQSESQGQEGSCTLCDVRHCSWTPIPWVLAGQGKEDSCFSDLFRRQPSQDVPGLAAHTHPSQFWQQTWRRRVHYYPDFCMAPTGKEENIFTSFTISTVSCGGEPCWLCEHVNLWGIGCCACPGALLSLSQPH